MRNIDWFPLSRQAGTRHCLQLGVVMKRKFSSSENSRPSPDLSNVLINSWPFPGLENSISNSRTFPEFPTAWQPWALAHPFAYLLSNIFWVPWSQRNHQNDRQLVAVACCNTWLKEKDQVRPCGEEKTKANSLFTKVIIIFIFIIHFLSIYAVVDMEKKYSSSY